MEMITWNGFNILNWIREAVSSFFVSSRRRHTRCYRDWSSDVCSSDLTLLFFQVVPKVAIAPLFLVWFGVGALPKFLVAFLISFFPIVIDAAVGLRSMSVEMTDLARSMGASRMQVFARFRLPTSLPYLFSGLKVAAMLAVAGAVVGEFVGADKGLGYLL